MLKQIKVGGFVYKVEFPYVFKERIDLMAQADHDTLKIRLTNNGLTGVPYAEEKKAEALLHEILHCIDAVYNNDSLSENQISSMSHGLYQVMVDNDLNEILRGKK